jgi:DNA-binding FrmR family transcriptional regulator
MRPVDKSCFEKMRMQIQNPEVKEKLIQRLRRIEGQLRGVQSMLTEERDCREVMQQLAAIHSAVQGVSRLFLQEYATACLVEPGDDRTNDDLKQQRQQIVQDLLALMDKTP